MQGRQGREGCDKSKLANNAVARACCHYREEVIPRVTEWCGESSGGVGGNGGEMPALAHAWESCARNALPRRWNAWQGQRELSTSAGVRNVFASSSARKRSRSLSHNARHVATWLANQLIWMGWRRTCAEGSVRRARGFLMRLATCS